MKFRLIFLQSRFLVYLLTLQCPFVDKLGKLQKEDLMKGKLPLWDRNQFSILFDEVKGLGNNVVQTSRDAKGLVRELLMIDPRQRMRCSDALKHAWFENVVSGNLQFDDRPLLAWGDFENGLKTVQNTMFDVADKLNEFGLQAQEGNQRKQLKQARQKLQIEKNEESARTRPPEKDCCICFHPTGLMDLVCPRCKNVVCASCLPFMQKAECPVCLLDDNKAIQIIQLAQITRDVMVNQAAPMAAQAVRETVNLAKEAGEVLKDEAILQGQELAHQAEIADVQIDFRRHNITPGNSCSLCNGETNQFDHACPCCGATTCSTCLQTYENPGVDKSCAKCGDRKRHAESIDAALSARHAKDLANNLFEGAKAGAMSFFGEITDLLTTNPTPPIIQSKKNLQRPKSAHAKMYNNTLPSSPIHRAVPCCTHPGHETTNPTSEGSNQKMFPPRAIPAQQPKNDTTNSSHWSAAASSSLPPQSIQHTHCSGEDTPMETLPLHLVDQPARSNQANSNWWDVPAQAAPNRVQRHQSVVAPKLEDPKPNFLI